MTDHTTPLTTAELEAPPEPPPRGAWIWAQENLFSSTWSTIITIVAGAIAVFFFDGMLNFILDDGRRWNSVATNFRLYAFQAYPEEQFIRVWVSVGLVFSLAGLSLAAWGVGGRMTVRKLLRSIMATAGFVAFLAVLAMIDIELAAPPVSVAEGAFAPKLWFLLAGAILGVVAYAIDQSLGERAKQMTVSTLTVATGVAWLVVLSLWVIPFGHYTFAAGEVGYEPGTIALSTKLPWTMMLVVAMASYGVGTVLRRMVDVDLLRRLLTFAWLLSIPLIALVILRDPIWDYDRILGVFLPLFAVFAVAGGLVLFFLSAPKYHDLGRTIGGIALVVALAAWFIPMLTVVRLMLLAFAIFAIAAPTFAGEAAARRRYVAVWVAFLAVATYFFAAVDGGQSVETPTGNFAGGLSLTFLVAITGILLSFPIGVLAALGRTSSMPIFRVVSTIYIEVVRGIPFITVLIFFDLILGLFLPDGVSLSDLVEAIIATTLFSGAYLAENVRGGLQSVRKGQYEASRALGMSTLQLTSFIVLPQALRAVIPALVGQAIAIFKDTSLLAIIGLFDLLFIGNQVVPNQTAFLGAKRENLLFVAVVYWIFTFSFSRASQRLEKKLGVGER